MATITASNFAAMLRKATLKGSRKVQSSPVLGLPVIGTNGRVRCRLEQKPSGSSISSNPSMVASLMAAAAAVVTTTAIPVLALVDESLSTEGTGVLFGSSNNLLGWIFFGVFGLIWALYFIYVSSFEEDEESALSL